MLPALSSISNAPKCAPWVSSCVRLHHHRYRLAGLGDRPRPAVAWEPDAYRTFAQILKGWKQQQSQLVMQLAPAFSRCQASGSAGRLCLVAPTWRGPLPTMMGGRRAMLRFVSRFVDLPVIGSALYRLNVNRPMIRLMARGMSMPICWLNQYRLAEKLAVTNAPGARHASFRFVAGELDPMSTRELFLSTARWLLIHPRCVRSGYA